MRLIRFHDYLFDVGIRDFKCVSREHINAYILSLARFSTTYISEALREIRRLLKLAYETGTTDGGCALYPRAGHPGDRNRGYHL